MSSFQFVWRTKQDDICKVCDATIISSCQWGTYPSVGHIFGHYQWWGATGMTFVEARDATQDSAMHRADPHDKDISSQIC